MKTMRLAGPLQGRVPELAGHALPPRATPTEDASSLQRFDSPEQIERAMTGLPDRLGGRYLGI